MSARFIDLLRIIYWRDWSWRWSRLHFDDDRTGRYNWRFSAAIADGRTIREHDQVAEYSEYS